MAAFKTMTIAEAAVAFLAENGFKYAIGIGGHGNTPILDALQPYHDKGKIRVVDVQHEAVAAHAATALKWAYGIDSVVFTSIGPGWLNTLLAQNTGMSNEYGFLVFAGDKTTAYEGPNMQQLMREGQFGFVNVANAVAKKGYCIIDPRNAYTVLREALVKMDEIGNAGPVNIFWPMNIQAAKYSFNLEKLLAPRDRSSNKVRPDVDQVKKAAAEIARHDKIAIRVGGGAVNAGKEVSQLAELIGAAVVLSPNAMDAIPSSFHLNCAVAGSKGSICGNYVSENATLIINIGGRGVCQADSSATIYAKAKAVIGVNVNEVDADRYNGIHLVGDAGATVQALIAEVKKLQKSGPARPKKQDWLEKIVSKKKEWDAYLNDYYSHAVVEGKLTQPAAIKAVDEYINSYKGIKVYDAGDVQANGFQIAEHVAPKTFFSDSGNSCMGFAVCAAFGLGLVKGGKYPTAIVGDGSFLIQAQAIRDMVKHNSNATVVVLDNQAMGAITALQWAQNYDGFATVDPKGTEPVDFALLAKSMGAAGFTPEASIDSLMDCLNKAKKHEGPAVVDVKVYFGQNKYGSLGAFGRWNVGPWSEAVEKIWEGK